MGKPREKPCIEGEMESLSPEQLAAIALFRTPTSSNIESCRKGIKKAGSVGAYISAKRRLAATRELVWRSLLENKLGRQKVETINDAKLLLSIRLGHLEHEVFASIFLDKAHRIITYRELFRGSIHGTRVHVREIVKEALRCNAASVVLAHNHPSGETSPSDEDCYITGDIITALSIIEVEVMDHIIVGQGRVLSFKEEGLIK